MPRIAGNGQEGDEMLSTLRSIVNAILGKVPGKPNRLDTATRVAMDAQLASDADFTAKHKAEPKGTPCVTNARPLKLTR